MNTALIRALQVGAWVKVRATGEIGQILIIAPANGQDHFMVPDTQGNGRQFIADELIPCPPPIAEPKKDLLFKSL